MKTHILTSRDVSKFISSYGWDKFMDLTIDALESGFIDYSTNKIANILPRSGYTYEEPNQGLLEWMPSLIINEDICVKMIGYHPQNPTQHNLPTIIGTILLFDTSNGHLKAIIDGTLLTAIRTGAASALATKYFSRQDSDSIGLIGCGAQAVTQLHAISRVRDIKKVYMNDICDETLKSFKNRMGSVGLGHLEYISSRNHELCKESDIICTATSKRIDEPEVLNNPDLLKKHVHINAIGSDMPGKFEVSKTVLDSCVMFPDFLEQALLEGECQQYINQQSKILPELPYLISNYDKYKDTMDTRSIFDSTGFSLEDHIIASKLISMYSNNDDCTNNVIETNYLNPINPYASS